MAPIATRGLAKRYDDLVALEDLSLEAQHGEVLGLLGPNGAGKSTTIKLLVGLVHPTEGRASIAGHDVHEEGPRAREHLGYLPEVVGLYDQLSAEAYLRYVGRFHGFSGPRATNRMEELLERVRLSPAASREIATFSKGMRQRLALAGALFHDPDVLLLDEPLTGLDPEGVIKMKQAIERLGRERTVLVSSHELHAVESLCDRAVILRDGRVLADAPVDELTRRAPPRYRVRVDQAPASPEELAKLDGIASVTRDEGSQLFIVEAEEEDAVSELVAHLVEQGARIREVARDHRTLEEAFVDITGVRT